MPGKGRKDKVMLAQLHIGYSYLTRSYMLKNEDQPICTTCQAALMVKQILTECTCLAPCKTEILQRKKPEEII